MKLTIENERLADAAQWAMRAVPARPPVPLLAGILINVTEDTLTLSGFDYYVSCRATENADIDEPGQAVVSGRLLTDIVRALPKQPVILTEDDTDLILTCGKARFTLPKLPLEEYPALPKLPAASGKISAAALEDLCTRVSVAAGTDATLPVLTGVEITYTSEHLTLGATDRYRFNLGKTTWTPNAKGKAKEGGTVLVPASSLRDVAKALGDTEAEATIAFTSNGFAVSTGDRHLTTGLLDGALPKYKGLFPTTFESVATTSSAELIAAVKRAALVLGKADLLFLEIAADQITVRAGTHDTGTALDCADASLEGEPLTIAFNPKLLLESLQGIVTESEQVQLNFTTPAKPATIHAPGRADSFSTLLMPIRTTETTPAAAA
ncbi:DNA polymerase III subunit beta [Streptomyces sp. H27-G5]|uniref:DNA polymerase III subunit beta n=1 Tax=Streptomyces sp. H27-G5 TaxID=2996698 RepID=UPI002271FB11|nr:DNA polymerase III subunit beta [Streptomyces sp. H27-G5]MCY0922880.1 DNA polymerase III subunit beta [Streptomyces sp. H27-G5]